MSDLPTFPAHGWQDEPWLSFHPEREEDRDRHPLKGLRRFGPLSGSLVSSMMDPIRVAAIFPHGCRTWFTGILGELNRGHHPQERQQYLVEYPGFSTAFRVRVVEAEGISRELPAATDGAITASSTPHRELADRLLSELNALRRTSSQFDVLYLFLPERWSPGFRGPLGEDFDLHDFLKAECAAAAIPLQILREDRVLKYKCRASVMWRLGLATYCKAGGIPWRIAGGDPGTAYIGLSYAIRASDSGPRFVNCCSQVFDADGCGLQFLVYESEEFREYGKNPFLTRDGMRRLMSRSRVMYQKRHDGRSPKRIVVYKTTPFRYEEIDGCLDAWRSLAVDLIQVQQDTPWRGIRVAGMHDIAGYPVHRGSYLPLSGTEALFWTQGIVPSVTGEKFYAAQKGIPNPLLLTRFSGHSGWAELTAELLGLTKMNWNNDSLYDRLPVTIEYASSLARIVKRLPSLSPRPYDFRYFM